jgi:hypothetical protein
MSLAAQAEDPILTVVELRGELVSRVRAYFAPDFPAPDWRAPYREPI